MQRGARSSVRPRGARLPACLEAPNHVCYASSSAGIGRLRSATEPFSFSFKLSHHSACEFPKPDFLLPILFVDVSTDHMPITSATLVIKDVYNGGKSYTFEVSETVILYEMTFRRTPATTSGRGATSPADCPGSTNEMQAVTIPKNESYSRLCFS